MHSKFVCMYFTVVSLARVHSQVSAHVRTKYQGISIAASMQMYIAILLDFLTTTLIETHDDNVSTMIARS